jgi:hypothetical protein
MLVEAEKESVETRFRCVTCGKLTSGRMPRRGDTSARYPRRHYSNDGKICEGVFRDAEWVDVEVK